MRGLTRTIMAAVIGYVAGLLPSAGLASRLAGGTVDLRVQGSGNPGATNAASELGAGWGAAVLVLDLGKGAAAAAVGRAVGGDPGGYAAGAGAIAGHVFPISARWRGGKGVATSAGSTLVLFPAYFPIDAAVAGLAATGTGDADQAIRISSLVWVGAAVLWWRRRLPNAWGPPPSLGLPAFATAGAALMLGRLAINRRAAAH